MHKSITKAFDARFVAVLSDRVLQTIHDNFLCLGEPIDYAYGSLIEPETGHRISYELCCDLNKEHRMEIFNLDADDPRDYRVSPALFSQRLRKSLIDKINVIHLDSEVCDSGQGEKDLHMMIDAQCVGTTHDWSNT